MGRAVLGFALGIVARLWFMSLRVTAASHPALSLVAPQPWVLALWHGQIFPLLAFKRRRRTAAMVSLSRDGDVLAAAFRLLDLGSVRGSSSRNAKAALHSMVKTLRDQWDGAFAVDGPRGPWHRPQAGALIAASRAHGVVVPFAAACSCCWTLRSWDRFTIPLPFSRIAVVLGAPIHPHLVDRRDAQGSLGLAIDQACVQAQALLDHHPVPSWTALPQEDS